MRHARRLIAPMALTTAVLALSAAVAAAAGWSEKATGGGQAMAGSTPFSVTMSVSDSGGQFQYSRDDLVFHGVADCLFVPDDETYAVLSGDITHAAVPNGVFQEGARVSIAILEGGEGAGDRVRVWAADACSAGAYGGAYPGIFVDGNVNIRTR